MLKNRFFLLFLLLTTIATNPLFAWYCGVCISYEGTSGSSHSKFQSMVETETNLIKKIIENTTKEQEKIIQMQREKVIYTAGIKEKYKHLVTIMKEKESKAKKINNLKCLELDTTINNLNSQIVEAEIVFGKFIE